MLIDSRVFDEECRVGDWNRAAKGLGDVGIAAETATRLVASRLGFLRSVGNSKSIQQRIVVSDQNIVDISFHRLVYSVALEGTDSSRCNSHVVVS